MSRMTIASNVMHHTLDNRIKHDTKNQQLIFLIKIGDGEGTRADRYVTQLVTI